MPAIWNVNNTYNTSNKKVSSKLTFEVGEKFNGKILEKGSDNQVTVKLSDGWQFPAEIDGDSNVGLDGTVQFEVSGFEDGKLKLKIIKGETSDKGIIDNNLKDIASKEGFSKEDISLMESMVKHNIPLTRENVIYIKSLVQFNDKIKVSPDESNEFINKLLQSKGIDIASESAQNIKSILNDFLEQYKTLSKKDILFFVENNIDINKENIESFNKLFKGNETIKDYFKEVDGKLNKLVLNSDRPEVSQVKTNSSILNEEDKLNSKDIKYDQNSTKNVSIASKAYSSNDISKGNVNILSALKSMAVEESNIIKEPIRDILIDRRNEFTSKQFKNINSIINNLSDDEVINNIVNDLGKEKISNKETLNKIVSNLFGKEINLTGEEIGKLKGIIDFKIEQGQNSEVTKPKDKDNVNIVERAKNNILDKEQVVSLENQNSTETDTNKVATKFDATNMDKLSQNKALSSIIESLEKESNITPQSLSRVISDALGKEINLSGDEFEKLNQMIISNEQNGLNEVKATSPKQVIDDKQGQSNVKNINEDKTIQGDGNNIKEDKSMQNNGNNIKEDKSMQSNGNNIKEQKTVSDSAVNNINKKSIEIENEVTKSKLDFSLNSKEGIKLDIKENIATIKDLVKDIIRYSEVKGESAEKVMELIKSNINDFKLINSISNEYYYLDIPVNKNGNDYPCKLIIKDNRKEGKKIDKTNVKMVLSVKTINLGSVDGYIGISNNKLDVDIKCNKEYVKIVENSKQKLIDGLSTLGFSINVKVTEKQEEVLLTSCREFFNDNNSKAIDIRV